MEICYFWHVLKDVKTFDIFFNFVIPLFCMVKWGQHLQVGLTYTTNSGAYVLINWRNQLALFGNLFCSFGVNNIWLYGTFKIGLLDVLVGYLFGVGPHPFDYVIFCPNLFGAYFQHFLL